MTEHGDQLRNAFETHEHLAPDAAAVYSRVQELSRSYQRRRWGVQAGGAVLGVSLIAGAVVTLPGLITGRQPQSVGVGAGAAPEPKPSASASSSEDELQRQYDAYFKAGYDYDDAVRLAVLWRTKDDIGAVKAEAGRRLLAGQTLPIKPTPDDPTPVDEISPAEQKQLDAYFKAGYNYDDAVKLAKLWKLTDPFRAKVEGGKRLLAHKKLPVRPSAVAEAKETARVSKFFAAGYDYDDAVKLAKLWKLTDPYAAKVEGGKRLLAGDTLPFKP
ncbi:hypothetical protein GCM10020358_22530 [Amorphoplanes nipponensis]|uniref:Uncharacterized protein n=1 Tax=Actinoplanes nipponensis TaxID=135950 RepID=A0A919JGZ2_9ACTN|nr:hypothetical protein [Actinoplanes nipponensis]GIE49125.1 hypothetical protein Ani05nite_26590 [Actinoplanes nipponensis]